MMEHNYRARKNSGPIYSHTTSSRVAGGSGQQLKIRKMPNNLLTIKKVYFI